MFPDSLQDNVPAFDSVAAFAISSHLAAMDVRVTIGAVGAGVRKYWLCMALGTGNAFV